jgi:small GTP-binding protein
LIFQEEKMPANLTPDYMRAEAEYKRATTDAERLDALKNMMATLPKHKGTEKLQADLKRRMAALREEIQKGDKKRGFGIKVDREGVGQVVLVGAPNCGKSQLAAQLSHTEVEVASYPFTTRFPHPVMMPYEDIQIQLVDLPPVSHQHMEFWVANIIRTADLLLLVCDLASEAVIEETQEVIQILIDAKMKLVAHRPMPDHWAGVAEKRVVLAGNKSDLPGALQRWRSLREVYGNQFPMLAVSGTSGDNLSQLALALFGALEVVRVYSKRPGEEPDHFKPYILPLGSSVVDFAQAVHRDFAEKLKFARLWGHGKFAGQRVMRDYLLQDRDIIELHT